MGEGLALAAILMVSQQHNLTNDAQYNNAIKHASLAAFKQSGLDKVANREIKGYERVYKQATPEEMQAILGWGFWVYKTMQDGKIVYSWSF